MCGNRYGIYSSNFFLIYLPIFIYPNVLDQLGLSYIIIGPLGVAIMIYVLCRLVAWLADKVHNNRIKEWKQAHPNDPRAKYL